MKMRKPKQEIILTDIEITDAGSEGNAIARVDNKVIFVPFVVPGDVVDIKIYKSKKNYAEGRAVAIKQYSPLRSEVKCPHFGTCGGCRWQNMDYAEQLKYKQKQVVDNLERLGKIDTTNMSPISGSDNIFYYRNKLEYTFSNRPWISNEDIRNPDFVPQPNALGFHIPGLFDKILDIEHCALQENLSNDIRLTIKEYALQHNLEFYDIRNHTGFLRNIVIRNTSIGEWMLVVIVAQNDKEKLLPMMEFLKNRFPQITSLQYIINEKLNDSYGDLDVITYSGKDYVVENMPAYKQQGKPLEFKIGPKSFYQTNSAQAYKLYSFAADFADLNGDEVVYDLYTGTGTIANFVARRCKKVVGIEYVEDAIVDAKHNSERNNIDNTVFYAGDMAKVLTEDFIKENGTPDLVITDPPRAGMHEKVIQQLLNAQPRKIVYISCNPATQARDIMLLSEKYNVGRIQPVDMFPHTQHVENVVELILKD